MPYKDLEARRAYNRKYEAVKAAKRKLILATETPDEKAARLAKRKKRKPVDPAKNRARAAAWYQANKSKAVLNCIKQRARDKEVPFDLTMEWYLQKPCECPQCNRPFSGTWRENTAAAVDRLIPALGYVMSNVEWICNECNRRKDNMTYAEMIEFGRKGLERTGTR